MTTGISIPEKLIGTVVILLNKNKVMLGKRKNSYRSDWYGMPGGRVETSEKLIDCAKRELTEETGLKVDNLEYIGVIRDLQEGYIFTHFAFLCKNYSGQPEKCDGWTWFKPSEIPEMTLPGHRAAIDIFLNPNPPSVRDVSSI